MRDILKSIRRSFVSSSIITIVLGILLVCCGSSVLKFGNYVLGALVMTYGIFSIFSYIVGRKEIDVQNLSLAAGILALVIGLVMILKPEIVLSILPVMFGIVLLFDGLVKLQRGFDLRRADSEGSAWVAVLIFSLIGIAFGVLLIVNPLDMLNAATWVVGLIFIVNGLSDLITVHRVSKTVKDIREALSDDVIDVESEKIK